MSKNKEFKSKAIPEKKLVKHYNLLRRLIHLLFPIFYPYELHGNLTKRNGPLIFIGNHYSYIDIAFPVLMTDSAVHFIAKQELWKKEGFVKRFVVNAGSIPVKRDGTDVQALKECLRILKQDGIINIFPEGTRNHSYANILPFKSGAAMLSIRTQTPIVPIVKITKMKLFHKTHVVYGDPIEFKQYYGKKVSKEELEECDEILRQSMQNMRLAFLDKHKIKIKSDKI